MDQITLLDVSNTSPMTITDMAETTNDLVVNMNVFAANVNIAANSYVNTVTTPSELLTRVKTVDGAASGLDADLLDGQEGSYYLPAASYTAADVLAKTLTVDGPASGLNADLLDGQEGSYYLPAASYTAADVKTKLLTVDGAASGLDADLLDGQEGSYYLPAASYTAADVKTKLLTVDGAASGLDADLLDGQQSGYYASNAYVQSIFGPVASNAVIYATFAQNSYVNSVTTPSEMLTRVKTVDGAASGLDADLLDGQHGSYYQSASNLNAGTLPDARLSGSYTGLTDLTASGKFIGLHSGSSYLDTNAVTRITFPDGAAYVGVVSDVGAFKITLPVSWTNTMMDLEIKVFDYASNESFTVLVSGFSHSTSSAWINTSAVILGNPSIDLGHSIRFGHDGTKCYIMIGEISSTWTYPRVTITKAVFSYSNQAISNWKSGWTISMETSIPGTVSSTITEPQIGRTVGTDIIWHAGNDGAGSGLDADLLDGQNGTYYLAASSYTAADVKTKLLTVDGAASGIDADLLDGQQGSYYLAASSYTAADVLAKTLTVDGAASGLDADLLDGQHGSYYTDIVSRLGYTPQNNLSSVSIIEINSSNLADTTNIIDFHTSSTLIDYNARIIRNAGTDGSFEIIQSGTGAISFTNSGAFNYNGNTIWHAGNDGAASGLDADLLDGQEGSYYLPAASYTAADVKTKLLTVDGAASGLDADLLDGQEGSYYQSASNLNAGTLPDARLSGSYTGLTDLTASGTLTVPNSNTQHYLTETNYLRIPALSSGNLASATVISGAIKVTLPVSWTNNFIKGRIEIYEYGNNESFSVFFAGYNYLATTQWLNTSAYIVGNPSSDRNFTVRFGHDGTNCCIYIGELATSWSYVRADIKDISISWTTVTNSSWLSGWTTSIESSAFGTITSTITGTQVGRTAPTAASGTNTTQLATTAFVVGEIALKSIAPAAVIEDQKASGTAGGTSVAATWSTRTLNTEVRDPSGYITLSSNQFTPSENGWVEWTSPIYGAGNFKTRLYNVTNSVVTAYGTQKWCPGGANMEDSSGGAPVVAGKTYRVEYYAQYAVTTNGLGIAITQGTEVYTRVLYWRT